MAAEEPEGLRNAERHPEPSEAAEPSCSNAGALTSCSKESKSREGPEKSGWELPKPGTYGFRLQFRQVEALQRQALAGADWTTG